MEVDESSLQIEGAAMVSNMLLSHSHRIGIPNWPVLFKGLPNTNQHYVFWLYTER